MTVPITCFDPKTGQTETPKKQNAQAWKLYKLFLVPFLVFNW